MDKKKSVIQLFPDSIRGYFEDSIKRYEDLSEIHIRCNKPIIIKRRKYEYILFRKDDQIKEKTITEAISEEVTKENTEEIKERYDVTPIIMNEQQLEMLFLHICRYSPYAFQDELRQGFITTSGGHRVGVAGQVVCQMGIIQEIRNIRFLNIRIAHEIRGAADECMPYLYDENGFVRSCLIIAPPGLGKTTLLRDLVRQISDGGVYGSGMTVGVVDERSEIAGAFMGVPQHDLGIRTDVLDGCPKSVGMQMLLRSMAPQVIAVDEIATDEDVKNLLLLIHCGVKVLVTVHGMDLEEVMCKPFLKPLFESDYFQLFLVIRAGEIKKKIIK